jgi:hypothetical protein
MRFTKNIQRRNRQNQTGGRLLIYTKENVNISRIIQLENNLDESLWVLILHKEMELSFELLSKLGGELDM